MNVFTRIISNLKYKCPPPCLLCTCCSLRGVTDTVLHHHAENLEAAAVVMMIQQLTWQSLEERRAVSRLTFTYKALHKMQNNCRQLRSPKVFQVIQTNSSQLIYIYLTQAGNQKRQYKNSLLPRTLSEWNLLPDHVKSAPSLDAFKAYLQDINITTLITLLGTLIMINLLLL